MADFDTDIGDELEWSEDILFGPQRTGKGGELRVADGDGWPPRASSLAAAGFASKMINNRQGTRSDIRVDPRER